MFIGLIAVVSDKALERNLVVRDTEMERNLAVGTPKLSASRKQDKFIFEGF